MTAALSAGGLMAKQDANAQDRRTGFVERISTQLNLSDQQKQQAKNIFSSERQAARSVRQELRQERTSVRSAIQAGRPAADVEQLAKNEAPQLGELAGLRAAAFAKFYAVLTPAQQQKFQSLHQEWRQRNEAGNTTPGR
jgi:Spy/CpxP family protein refolding chaperone